MDGFVRSRCGRTGLTRQVKPACAECRIRVIDPAQATLKAEHENPAPDESAQLRAEVERLNARIAQLDAALDGRLGLYQDRDMLPVLENFERAFTTSHGSCRAKCECGREFYNPDGGWDWEEGELEALEKSGAKALDWTVGEIWLEGKEYVPDCDCWHPRAVKIIAFVRSHGGAIAEFLTLEKARKQREADSSPIVR